MAETPDLDLNFDLNNMTLGQTEFVTDYTGRGVNELLEVLQSGDLGARDLIAIMCLARNQEDPASELETVRNLKVIELNTSDLN